MPGQMRVELKGFTPGMLAENLHLASKVKVPRYSSPAPGEQSLVKGALRALAVASPTRAPRINGLIGFFSTPAGSMSVAGTVPGAIIRSPSPDFTVALGLVASAGAGLSAGLGAGVYFWNKRPGGEIGLYGSLGLGMVGNVGMGIGDSLSLLFGTAPAVLAGDIIAIEVDVGIDFFTASGVIFITAPPVTLWPPALTGGWVPEIVGVGIQLTVGFSALPFNIAVTPSRTWIKPLT